MAPHREPRQGTAAGYRRGTRGGVARRAAARGTGCCCWSHTDGYAVGLDTRELVRFDTDFSVTISPWEVAEDGAVSD